jgi:hypothetical protein
MFRAMLKKDKSKEDFYWKKKVMSLKKLRKN